MNSSAAFTVFVGLLLIAFSLHLYWKRKQIEKWPMVKGVVKGAAVQSDRSISEGTTYFSFSLSVGYTYEFEGKEYFSHRFAYANSGNALPFGLNKKARKYRNGVEVDVFIFPGNPKISYLELPPIIEILLFTFIGLSLVVVAMFILSV